MPGLSLFDAARQCLDAVEVDEKIALTQQFTGPGALDGLGLRATSAPLPITVPGRPARPRLVAPRNVARRALGSSEGRAALVHAVAHIEFNAINLAWDAVYRFRGMPHDYYRDWAQVAADEARHFGLLKVRLAELGYGYGDFDAHDGLWEMAVKTADSCLARMALVPRVLEARGLDVTPGMIVRLERAGDRVTAEILEVILAEEVAHVAAGSRWFEWCCANAGLDPEVTFAKLLETNLIRPQKGPFNVDARRRAGFSRAELARMHDAWSRPVAQPTPDTLGDRPVRAAAGATESGS